MGKFDVNPGWKKISNRDGAAFTVSLMPNVLTQTLSKKLESIPTKKIGKPTYAPDELPDLADKNHDIISVQTVEDALALLKVFLILNIPNILTSMPVEETEFQKYLT